MRVQTFNGGLNTRPDPHLIQSNEAQVYHNIDDTKGSLTPAKGKLLDAASNRFSFWFQAEQRWISSEVQTSWVEFQKRVYLADEAGQARKIIDGEEYALGLIPPADTLKVEPYLVGNVPTQFTTNLIADECVKSSEPGVDDFCFNSGNLSVDRQFNYVLINVVEDAVEGDIRIASAVISRTIPPVVTSNYRYGTGTGSIEFNIEAAAISDRIELYRELNGVFHLVGQRTTEGKIIDNVAWIQDNAELVATQFPLDGVYTYAVTFVSSIDGAESVPVFSSEVTVDNQEVYLSNIPQPTQAQVGSIRIYRVGGNITTFSLVEAVAVGTTDYIDATKDTDIDGRVLTSQNNRPPPEGLKYLLENNAILFGAVDDRAYFTEIGRPDVWPVNNYLDFPTEVTALGKCPSGLIVCTQTQTFLVSGSGPATLAVQLMSGSQGCINHYTMQNLAGSAIWVSENGVCMTSGGPIELITEDKLGEVKLNTVNAVVHNLGYYIQEVDNNVLCIDFARTVIKTYEDGTDSLIVGQGRLYGHNDGNRYELFASDDNLDMSYSSPEFSVEGLTQLKIFKQFYFQLVGSVQVTISMDGQVVMSKLIEPDSSTGISQAHANVNSRGVRVQFQISGTGKVQEIYWRDESANV